MRFKSLTVAGAVPFPQQMTINIPEQRKVALTGDNGAGKSTVFDCIYAAFFGDVTKPNGLYSLFKNSKDGLIDLTFEMKGSEYRIRRLIDGVGRKQKPYFYVDGQPITEGKVAEFESKVRETLGISEKAFLASVYNAQTQKGNPLSMNDRDRRDLLTEVLGLGQFDAPFDLVSNQLSNVLRNADALETQRMALSTKLQDPAMLQQQKADIKIRLVELEQRIEESEKLAQKYRQDLANAQANAQQLEEINRQIDVLQQQIDSDKKAIADLEAKVQKNRSELLDKADEIRAAAQAITVNQELLPGYKETEALIANDLEKWHETHRNHSLHLTANVVNARTEVDLRQRKLERLEKDKANLQAQLKGNESSIASLRPATLLLESVPCKGMEINNTCDLLKNAHASVGQITLLEKEIIELAVHIEAKSAEITAVQAEIAECRAKVSELEQQQKEWNEAQPPKDLRDRLEHHRGLIKTAEAKISELAPLAKNEPYLKDAEDRIAGYEQEINVCRLRMDSNADALTTWQKKRDDAKNLQETISLCQREIQNAEGGRAAACQEKDQLSARIGQLDALIDQALSIQKEIEELAADRETLLQEVSLLEFLKEGLGPKGARALKIDSAGPEISELVNALLRECYGQKFTILIKTLRDLQSGEQREKLEFSIIDNETGEETPVENKSGGEQQLIKEVISLGLCIYQRRRAGIDTRTIIRDESCSALTEENTERYVRMLDKACQIGGFDQVLYVSHKSCAQQMADAVIAIEDGKAKVIQG